MKNLIQTILFLKMRKINEKVTVAIPVYNGEKFIQETLNSITNQTRKVDRILICDN